MKTEKSYKPINGYLMFGLLLAMVGLAIWAIRAENVVAGVIAIVLGSFIGPGFFIVNPNTSKILLLFGDYRGTVKESGFWWVIPFFVRTLFSLKARNFESERIKVNDKTGNPILISVILVWRVKDTYKAAFEVNDFENFVKVQTDSAVRKLAGTYPYDHYEDETAALTLSSNSEEVNAKLEAEIAERLTIAGIEVIEARIGYLAYAPEIAQVMLRRQQASAVIAARNKIVQGAVGMVESALNLLSKKQIIDLDQDRKAAMVSNLMIVLCSEHEVEPIVNTGTLYQ
jgi:regulator of protease activity HflC (stomatin/prohibitin superfamily)